MLLDIVHEAIVPLSVVSFLLFGYQYFRINPERRVLNLHFALMLGTIALMLAAVYATERTLLLVLFALTLFALGLSIYLSRNLPPPRV
jgi:hypothetical protein